ncbi:MAG: sugar phosphate isomerase/epimerase [Fimbriimonadales bacterium]|nr:sugar phosphate isomerase/epimerase [Fimbriimonadales bacterium]MDW8052052.1 sugar phosphate isomerase/epimerase family protein [Armatimonadota bacterium]
MRYALCNEVVRHLRWADACALFADAGYEGVELAPFTFAERVEQLDAEARASIRRIAHQHGLQIVGLHMLLWSPPGMHATHPDPAIRRATAEYLVALVHFCADVGGQVMVFGSPKQREAIPPLTPHEAAQLWLDTLQPALRACEQYGILMLLEPLPETNVVQRLEEAVALVRQANHPNLRTMLDVKSALAESNDVPALIRQYAPYIAHVHLNDSNLRAPGFGDTNFAPIIAALRAIGYTGWASLEPFDYYPDPETLARESLRYLRSL